MPEGAGAARSVPLVKICGLTRRNDALDADALGADYLGVVLSSGFARSVPAHEGPALLEGVRARRVAVLVDERPEDAVSLATALGADVLQLHGSEEPTELDVLRRGGRWELWKAVRARRLEDIEAAVSRYGEVADALLLEGWRDGVVGGGGASLALAGHAVREAIPTSLGFVLAGGLTPESVCEAVARFHPDLVDVSSGVERSTGEKDVDLVGAFIRAARSGSDGSTGVTTVRTDRDG